MSCNGLAQRFEEIQKTVPRRPGRYKPDPVDSEPLP